MKLSGIDISHHNYELIRAKGAAYLYDTASLGFVICKATEGATWTDPRLNDYIRMLGEANIKYGFCQTGFYHYARPENNVPEAEAKYFYETIKKFNGSVLPALDVEGRALLCPDLDSWVLRWLRAYESLSEGVKPVVYIQRSALKLFEKVPAADFGLWLAAWTKVKPAKVEPWPFMALWQDNGMNLDTDIFFGNVKQWNKYCTGGK